MQWKVPKLGRVNYSAVVVSLTLKQRRYKNVVLEILQEAEHINFSLIASQWKSSLVL